MCKLVLADEAGEGLNAHQSDAGLSVAPLWLTVVDGTGATHFNLPQISLTAPPAAACYLFRF